MNRRFVLLAIAGALVVPAVYSITRPDPEAKAKADGLQTLVSDPYRLDKIYRSMEGPWSIQSGIHLATGAESGVLWVTGLETEVVDATAQKPFFFFKQKTAYEMSIGDWSSDVCSSD